MSGQVEADQAVMARKKRRDAGIRLTPRDRILLRMGGEQYALRFDQSQRMMARYSPASELQTPGVLSESATRHRLDDLEKAGLIMQKKRLADVPGVFWLTALGYREIGLPFRVSPPALDDLEHIYWCAQVRLWLMVNRPELAEGWKSERWQRRELDQKIKQVKLPDALIQPATGGTIAVEIELSTKGGDRLVDALRARALIYDQVWYICRKEGEKETGKDSPFKAVQTAREKLEPLYQQKILIYELKQYEL